MLGSPAEDEDEDMGDGSDNERGEEDQNEVDSKDIPF
jgi:hypothetical protein